MSSTETMTALPLTPFPQTKRGLDELAANRLLLAQQATDHDTAWTIVEEGLRAGLWRSVPLWLHLTERDHVPGDYSRLRELWLDSPRGCRSMPMVVSVVARAAALDGEHDEARALLRKALLLTAQHRRRLTTRVRRATRVGASEWPIRVPERADDTESPTTAVYFRVLEAMSTADRAGVLTGVDELRNLGEGDWLTRL